MKRMRNKENNNNKFSIYISFQNVDQVRLIQFVLRLFCKHDDYRNLKKEKPISRKIKSKNEFIKPK